MFSALRKALDWLRKYLASLGKWASHNQASSIGAGLAFAWACAALYFNIGGDIVVVGGLAVFLIAVPLLNMVTT